MSSNLPRDLMICVYCGNKNAIKGFECCEDCVDVMLEQTMKVLEYALNGIGVMINDMEINLAKADQLGWIGWSEEQKKQAAHTLRLMKDEKAELEGELLKLKQ